MRRGDFSPRTRIDLPMSMRLPCIALTAVLLLPGCATVMGEASQKIVVQTLDEQGKPIQMRCHASHAPAEYFGTSPMFDLEVRRSSSDLTIECRQGERVARATAVSRGANPISAVLPGGTASLIVDHITGYSYAYPAWIQLKIGQTLVFDAGNRIAGRPTPGLQAETR